MELFSHPVATRALERILIVTGALVLVAVLCTGCGKVDQEEETVKKGKVKGTVGTSIDLDVPIQEVDREIRPATESTTKGTSGKAANAPFEGDKADTLKLFEK